MSTLIMQECNRTLVQPYRLPPTKITCLRSLFVSYLFYLLLAPTLWYFPPTTSKNFRFLPPRNNFFMTSTRFILKIINSNLRLEVGVHACTFEQKHAARKKKNSLAWGRNSWNVRNLYDTCLLVLLPLSKKLDHSSQMCGVELRTYPITFLESRSMRIVIRFKIWNPFWCCSS